MREIKFRAWDKVNKRWIKLWKLCFAVTGELMAVDDIEGEVYGLHQVKLTQYTGLKDKDGKEIYEGDILKNLGMIEWGEEGENPEGTGWIIQDFHGEYHYTDAFTTPKEVIGNIHETSELLGKG
mgnify:CR=1 FL=1